MSSFQIAAIPSAVAESVRATGKAPGYGFPAHRQTAAGRAPCRHCLRLIGPEEELLLFTYDPFGELGDPPLPGPVYIHAQACQRRTDQHCVPEEYKGRPLTLLAYGQDRRLLEEKRLNGGGEDQEAERLLRNPAVHYLHARSSEAGCYLFRLERNGKS